MKRKDSPLERAAMRWWNECGRPLPERHAYGVVGKWSPDLPVEKLYIACARHAKKKGKK